MRFAPQRRALFRYLKIQKRSGADVLRATMPSLFRHLNFKKCSERAVFLAFSLRNVLRATTARWLRTAAVASLLFDPPEPQIIRKKKCFRGSPTFARISIFFLLTLSLLWSSLFYSSLLSDSSHLCFSSFHIVGNLTSKLPSNIESDHARQEVGPFKYYVGWGLCWRLWRK